MLIYHPDVHQRLGLSLHGPNTVGFVAVGVQARGRSRGGSKWAGLGHAPSVQQGQTQLVEGSNQAFGSRRAAHQQTLELGEVVRGSGGNSPLEFGAQPHP